MECNRAPDLPDGPKFFNYDSGPFPTGPLHMGHVRTYALGDVTARYQRLLGKSVLYCTEWDAFGLPNELAALREGTSPPEFTRRWIGTMTRQLRALGISYDWSRVRSTCDPSYYRWTQWLFLEFLERGLIERRETDLSWCSRCTTGLSRFQVDDDRCWRCGETVEIRRLTQWFVVVSRYSRLLHHGLDRLGGWSRPVRQLVRGIMRSCEDGAGRTRDWLVSRQRSWGTPIPIVHCETCGVIPVPTEELPLRLPDDLDWSLGSDALASHRTFADTCCPACGRPARRETDTLDCFFDDIWCFLACLIPPEQSPGVRDPRVERWMPVDCFHSGFDTAVYLHLHRILGAALEESGALQEAEPILGHFGHEMILNQGRKMSKQLGNAISPSKILRAIGADALRLGVLWAARPHRAVDWRPELVDRAAGLLAAVHRLYTVVATPGLGRGDEAPSRAVELLRCRTERSVQRIARFIEGYRPHAAVQELAALLREIEAFTLHRVEAGRLRPTDGPALRRILESYAIALSPFAPHLAEEAWHKLGNPPFVVRANWPAPGPAVQASVPRTSAGVSRERRGPPP